MSPRISWLLKAAKKKIFLKLPVCSQRQAGFQSNKDGTDLEGPLKADGPQSRPETEHALTWTELRRFWVPPQPKGTC